MGKLVKEIATAALDSVMVEDLEAPEAPVDREDQTVDSPGGDMEHTGDLVQHHTDLHPP